MYIAINIVKNVKKHIKFIYTHRVTVLSTLGFLICNTL